MPDNIAADKAFDAKVACPAAKDNPRAPHDAPLLLQPCGFSSQYIFLHFSGGSFREFGLERNTLWRFKMRQMGAGELSQLVLGCRCSCSQDDKGVRRLTPVVMLKPYNCNLLYCGMAQ